MFLDTEDETPEQAARRLHFTTWMLVDLRELQQRRDAFIRDLFGALIAYNIADAYRPEGLTPCDG